MKKKIRNKDFNKHLKNYKLEERRAYRQSGIAMMSWSADIVMMSWSADIVMLSGLFDERVEAVTADQIEGSFAFNAKCEMLVEKFKRLNDENVSEPEQKHIHY